MQLFVILSGTHHPAQVAKLVDAPVLGTGRAICGGSSPLLGTKENTVMRYFYLGTGSKTWEVLREDLKSFCARFNRRENIAKRYTERVSVQVLS